MEHSTCVLFHSTYFHPFHVTGFRGNLVPVFYFGVKWWLFECYLVWFWNNGMILFVTL